MSDSSIMGAQVLAEIFTKGAIKIPVNMSFDSGFYTYFDEVEQGPLAWTYEQWVAFDKTRCKNFDLLRLEQWVLGDTVY